MLFDGPPPELPIATLRPSVFGRRTILVDVTAWIARRRAWLLPRAVPLLAALIGLFATLGAVKAIGLWSHREPLRLRCHATALHHEPLRAAWRTVPVRIVIRPLAPSDPYVELTIGTPESR